MSKTSRHAASPGKRRGQGPGTRVREWVGGRVTLPVYITEAEPFRPEMVLWLELPDDFIVGSELIDPRGPPLSFSGTLLRAMASPLMGSPRRPRRIRVGEAHLAMELRSAVPDIEVVVAPTPELDAVIAQMVASMPGGSGGPSYLEHGRIEVDAVAALFHAAAALFRSAPWKVAQDSQALRLDIPALGVEGACVSVIGALGESLGLVVFPSHLAMERFLTVLEAGHDPNAPLDMGTTTLSLNFERGADLPAGMRREVAEHGWPVAGPAAYPLVQHRDRDGTPRPLDARDLGIVTACTNAVAAFFAKHSAHVAEAPTDSIRERIADAAGVETWLAMPYEAGGPPVAGAGPAEMLSVAARAAELHRIDGRLVETLTEFAVRRFADPWRRAARGLTEREGLLGLLVPWLAYQVLFDGKTLAHWFAQQEHSSLSGTELTWLDAQQAAWLSVWEVLAVEPGRGLKLRDLLTGEVREVQEVGASQALVVRFALLARVVDYQGLSLLCGNHARPLPPREAARVVGHTRALLRRGGLTPRDRLREEKMGRYLISRWEEALADLDGRPEALPRLQNTDGDDLLLTVDRFTFDPLLRSEIEARLARIEGVRPLGGVGSERDYLFERPGSAQHGGLEVTLVGSLRVGDGRLRLETNSVVRADRMRMQIEAVLGDRIRHRSREHTDPVALIGRQDAGSAPAEGASLRSSEEANTAILEVKRRHYADWSDQPLPALGGKSPRAVLGTQAGREQVDLLLKEFELSEARQPEGRRFDFSGLRRELGLPD